LKANQNMLALQEELTSTENKIGFARQAFNDAATNYNIRRQVFPAVKVAGMFGFKDAALLETAETERAAPKGASLCCGRAGVGPRHRYRICRALLSPEGSDADRTRCRASPLGQRFALGLAARRQKRNT